MADSTTGARLERFDFKDPPNTAAFICQHVAAGDPILYVSHDEDGDWQFLCGRPHGEDAPQRAGLVCLADVVRRDPELNTLATLCSGHHVERTSAAAAWSITDDGEEFIRRCVKEFGWAVQLIDKGEGPSEPAFAYTIGLHHNFGHPELIIFGQPNDLMHAALNEIGDRIKDGARYASGDSLDDVIEGYPVRLREVECRESFKAHVGYALWFYAAQPFRLFQILWPDKDWRFPGEPGAWEILKERQPLLP